MIPRCDIVELRRYTLRPGARETLIELFERALLEPQEAVGMHVLGQFRDLDDPDAFVWLRGFRDMDARARGLEAFYGGPVWREHRDAANATMIDSDDVLLLRPASLDSGLALDAGGRIIVITVCPLAASSAETFPAFFEQEIAPAMRAADVPVLASYRTEHSPNNFPALPIREDEEVFVWISAFDDLETSEAWRDRLSPALAEHLVRAPDVLRLSPTDRSRLH